MEGLTLHKQDSRVEVATDGLGLHITTTHRFLNDPLALRFQHLADAELLVVLRDTETLAGIVRIASGIEDDVKSSFEEIPNVANVEFIGAFFRIGIP